MLQMMQSLGGGIPGNVWCSYTYWINRNLDRSLPET